MKRYILSGTPGSGKTSIIQNLKLKGFETIDEAATDVIAQQQKMGIREPWKRHAFIDSVLNLQQERLENAQSNLQFYDRSPICTYALSLFLDFPISNHLLNVIKNNLQQKTYEMDVFFVENLGFIKNTDARKISFENALRFEKMHLDAYEKFGYNLIFIQAGRIDERTSFILNSL